MRRIQEAQLRNFAGLALCITFAAAMCTSGAHAQGGVLIQGVVDAEGWRTDSASFLLARGSGKPSLLGRADIWAAYEPFRNVVFFGEYLGETGPARGDSGSLALLKQAGVRMSVSDAFTLQAGKLPQLVGTFTERSLSFRNPLIAIPDGYSLSYPLGARVEGYSGMFDYRVGLLSLALYRKGYTPDPGTALRPSAGIGVTPMTGLRFGMSATVGPYLSDTFTVAALRSQNWKEYKQHVMAGDIQFSRGYFDLHAEIAHSGYDVPTYAKAINGLSWYIEPVYTLTPRVYVAARVEQNDYPFIAEFAPEAWVANGVTFNDAEVALGFRPSASQLLKASFRKDHWLPNMNPAAPHDDGFALALQFSQRFDLIELVTKRH